MLGGAGVSDWQQRQHRTQASGNGLSISAQPLPSPARPCPALPAQNQGPAVLLLSCIQPACLPPPHPTPPYPHPPTHHNRPQVLLFLGVGGAVGVVGGGIVGQWLYNRHKWAMSLFIGAPRCRLPAWPPDRPGAPLAGLHLLSAHEGRGLGAAPAAPPACPMLCCASQVPNLALRPLHNAGPTPLFAPAGGCTVAGTLPMFFLVNADVASMVPLTILCSLLAGGLSGTVGPNMRWAGGRGGVCRGCPGGGGCDMLAQHNWGHRILRFLHPG